MNQLPVAMLARQRGTILILYMGALFVILGFAGLVLDLGLVYLRRVQLQAAADTIAVSAALRLNGSAAGITAAVDTAQQSANAMRGDFGNGWRADALRFSDNPDSALAQWLTAGEVAAANAAARMLYTRVDIGALPATLRMVQPVLLAALGAASSIDVRPVAVAGRRTLNVTPLAICARNNNPAATRIYTDGSDERVTYGFRYGISYNLLNLNPANGATTGAYFLVDPVTPPGSVANGATTADAIVAPFMCSGTLAYSRAGGRLHVRQLSTFSLSPQLNSRFGQYGGTPACTRAAALPDTNVMSYDNAGTTWVNVSQRPLTASARPATVDGGLATVADLPPGTASQPPVLQAPGDFGAKWAYGNAKKADGTSRTTGWTVLYPASSGHLASWPPARPYNTPIHMQAPTPGPARRGRRMMHIPLLDCTANTSPATVIAYGMFFLTARATNTEVAGEFAGAVSLANEAVLSGDVELFQ